MSAPFYLVSDKTGYHIGPFPVKTDCWIFQLVVPIEEWKSAKIMDAELFARYEKLFGASPSAWLT